MNLNKQNLEKEFDRLIIEYSRGSNPEVLEKIYEVADRLVLDEKIASHLRHLALERLEELETMVELNPLLLYRKAVTLLLMKKKDQALELFRNLIQSEQTDTYIKDRCKGYMLKYYGDVVKTGEAINYLKDLRKTSDPTALHMLEEAEMSGQIPLDSEWEEEEEEGLEEPLIVFTSFDRIERSFSKKVTEASFRLENGPEDYDLYLDLIQRRYFIFGKEMDFSNKEVATLFTMARMGSQCNMYDLYLAVYGEEYEEQKKQKDKLQQFISRFRRNKLATHEFTFQGTTLPGRYTYCLIYNSQYQDNLTKRRD
jgi:hypothetical protein